MNRFEECLKLKKVNQSRAREAIYRVLIESKDECLCVSDILKKLPYIYSKRVSLNTVYRHLNLFISCELALMVQDDFKKAYYILTENKPLVFTICKRCNKIEKDLSNHNQIIKELEKNDFITIHKKCRKCS